MPVVVRLLVYFSCALGFLLTCIGARAQSVNATMVGTIFDTSSAAIPQAKVTVTNKGTNVARTVTGNERGDYTITNLAPSLYHLAASHEGSLSAAGQLVQAGRQVRDGVVASLVPRH